MPRALWGHFSLGRRQKQVLGRPESLCPKGSSPEDSGYPGQVKIQETALGLAWNESGQFRTFPNIIGKGSDSETALFAPYGPFPQNFSPLTG